MNKKQRAFIRILGAVIFLIAVLIPFTLGKISQDFLLVKYNLFILIGGIGIFLIGVFLGLGNKK